VERFLVIGFQSVSEQRFSLTMVDSDHGALNWNDYPKRRPRKQGVNGDPIHCPLISGHASDPMNTPPA
jgi:hypothetical protein